MIDSARILSDFSAKLSYEDLSPKTVENTRLYLIDYVAAAMAGYRVNKIFNSGVEKYIYGQGGCEEATPLFRDQKLPCASAAFLNACYAHGADMDDGNRKAMGHVGAHVFSSVLALAEANGASEKEIITAVNVGYEVYCRIAAAAQPGLVHRGFHSTGTAGAVACAAACAKLLGMDSDGIYNSMAISVTMASGLMIIAESGQSIKPLNPAKAAQSGILAAFLTKNGTVGGDRPLDSDKGWFHAMSDKIDYSMITDGLGKDFCINESYIKPYPSCRHTHCGIEAIMLLGKENNLKSEDVKKININIYENAIKIAGKIKWPANTDDSKFSVHYSAACALVLGRFTLEELDFTKVSDSVRKMTEKIELIPDDSMENRDAGIRGCRVSIIMNNGKIYEKEVLIPKGDPQNPFTFEDMRSKFGECSKGLMTLEQSETLFNRLRNFGHAEKYKRIGI